MEFKIGGFYIRTDIKKLTLDEQIAVPQSIKFGKLADYKWEYKTRDINIFKCLLVKSKNEEEKYYPLINDVFDFIDLIEALKGFSGSKLMFNKEYKPNDKFTAKIVQEDGITRLCITFFSPNYYKFTYYFDKLECSMLAAKFSKVLQRVEAWQEQEV